MKAVKALHSCALHAVDSISSPQAEQCTPWLWRSWARAEAISRRRRHSTVVQWRARRADAVEAFHSCALHIFSSRVEGGGTPRLCSGGIERAEGGDDLEEALGEIERDLMGNFGGHGN